MNGQKLVIAALFVIVGGAGILQCQLNRELRAEIAVLRGEVQSLSAQRDEARRADAKMTVATADNAAKANEQAELMQLRTEVNALKAQAKQLPQAKLAKGGDVAPTPALNLIPASAWKNSGKAAPAAALETVFWAAAGGDVDAMTEVIGMGTRAKERAAALFASLPESTQAQYGSPEKLVALFVAQGASPVQALQVLDTKPGDDPGETEMTVLLQGASGGMKKDDFTLRQYPDGWRFMISASTVDKIARHLSGTPKPEK